MGISEFLYEKIFNIAVLRIFIMWPDENFQGEHM